MKKIIAVTAALMMASLSAFALDITVGARGNFNMGLGTSVEGSGLSDDFKKDCKGNLGGGFGIYGNFGLMELGGGSLGIQPEFDMNFNNGFNYKHEDSENMVVDTVTTKDEMSYFDATIDIPVLVTFTYPVMDTLSIGGGFGPYISIPVGIDYTSKHEVSYDVYTEYNDSYSSKGSDNRDFKAKMNFGLAFDVNGAYKVGPGSIALDIRYMLDLTPTSVSSKYKSGGDWSSYSDIFTRRMLTIGVGYQIKF